LIETGLDCVGMVVLQGNTCDYPYHTIEPTQSKPVSIKLDADTQERIKRLATSRERSAHWLMREAISQYVEREELRETFHRDTLEAWQEFQETGQYATAQDVDQWLASWGTDAEGAPPACHQ
jgi:predicted transcriptional regulator